MSENTDECDAPSIATGYAKALTDRIAELVVERDAARARSERMAAGLRELYRTLPAGEHLGIVTGLMSDWHPWPETETVVAVGRPSDADAKPVPTCGACGAIEGMCSCDAEPAVALCPSCQRRTWEAENVGKPCGMPQPNGTVCQGVFRR